jgi:hypothetical protein
MWNHQEKINDLEYAKYFLSLGFNVAQIETAMTHIESCQPISIAIKEAMKISDVNTYDPNIRCSE